MPVRMRLRREGKRKQPFYRVVVADVRSPRDGRFIEDLGYYQPLADPSDIKIDRDRALYWLREGVQPSDAVRQLLRVEGIWEEFKPGDPGKDRSRKHAQRAARKAEQDAKRAEAEQAARAARAAEEAPAEEAPAGEAPAEDAPAVDAAADEPAQAEAADAPSEQPDEGKETSA